MRTNNPICGAFRGFGANQAQFAMEGVLDRLAVAGGDFGLGDPQAQRHQAGRGVGPGPDHGRRLPRGGAVPGRGQTSLRRRGGGGQGGRTRAGPQELGAGQRLQGAVQGGRALLETTARSRSATAGPRWARACTPSPSRSRWRSSASAPERIRVLVDTSRELGFGQTTGSRGTLMGAGAVADACRAADAGGRQVGRGLRGRVPGRLDQLAVGGAGQPGDPLGIRLRHPAGDHGP